MIDRDAVAAEVSLVSSVMRGHAGGLELLDVSEDGDVTVGFTGMCCGCPYKALTWNATVRPALEGLPGVRSLSAPGVRISDEAAARLRYYVELTRPGRTS